MFLRSLLGFRMPAAIVQPTSHVITTVRTWPENGRFQADGNGPDPSRTRAGTSGSISPVIHESDPKKWLWRSPRPKWRQTKRSELRIAGSNRSGQSRSGPANKHKKHKPAPPYSAGLFNQGCSRSLRCATPFIVRRRFMSRL